ncbi:MAG: M61 family metallopeptidase [Deltaproteobacteria bacterium]|nr:M61 family metallopeptidase [Deltaproteobacteria bacterium]
MARIHYRLSFPNLHAHLVSVEARFIDAAADGPEVDLKMAAWTPGSYMIREYSRHVQDLVASDEDGRSIDVVKVDKATWRARMTHGRDLVVRYRVFGHELTVRTNHVDGTHAFLNGAPTFLWVEKRKEEPALVEIEAPPGFHVATSLDLVDGTYLAANLDELIDSPIHVGPSPALEFSAAGRTARLALWGRFDMGKGVVRDARGPDELLAQLVADTQSIMEAHARVFGGVPYEHYTFLLLLSPGAYGGLEHKRSTALLASPFAFASRKQYEELLELISHEYFHLWNVKRIRPSVLGPFAYDREAYTRSLWVMEGVTSTYDRLTLRRAGVLPAKRFFEKLCEEWSKLLAIPGRKKQSLEESSLDAWIKLYRPDENSVNSTVSYYLKGGLVATCLDLDIRLRTEGERSLDDVLRHLWRRYGEAPQGFKDADVQREFEEATGLDLGDFFDRFVRGREDPDLEGALAKVGLALKASYEREGGEETDDVPPAWLGVNTQGDGRVVVASTLSESPAERHGLYAGDQIVAVDGFRVDDRTLAKRILSRRPGDSVRLTLFRRDELFEINVVLGERPRDRFEIAPAEAPSEDQRARYAAWMGEDLPLS